MELRVEAVHEERVVEATRVAHPVLEEGLHACRMQQSEQAGAAQYDKNVAVKTHPSFRGKNTNL